MVLDPRFYGGQGFAFFSRDETEPSERRAITAAPGTH